jgi:glycosyltransferase involved in cell wall biosynthesis
MAKIDVVVPCYNYGRFLEACVGSVLNQSVHDVRVLIIDDASSDNSALVAQRLAAGDPRVEVKIHSQNQGHIKTYNEGIEWAESNYFLLLSADDLLVPGAFERATGILDREPHVVLTYGRGIDWQANLPFPAVETERSGIRRSERNRIIHGIELLRLSTRLNPKFRYSHLLGELLRLPGPEVRGWPVSVMRQVAGKLRGRTQRI